MLEQILSTCGLNQSEQQVLIYLCQTNSSTAGKIAIHTKLKRPTVYAVLENLRNMNIVTKRLVKNVTTFSVIPNELLPKVLEGHARREYEKIKEASDALQPYLILLSKNKTQKISSFQILSLDSPESAYAQFEHVLLSGNYSSIFNPQTACIGNAKPVVERFLKETGKTCPPIREIAVSGPVCNWYKARISNPNHQLKEIAADKKVFSDIIILNDGIVVTHHEKGLERGISVKQDAFHHSMQEIFELLWTQLD